MNDDNKGSGWHDDPAGHKEAGREGEETTAQTHDEEFYSDIGQEDGEAAQRSRKAHKPTDEEMSHGGQKGGRG